MDIKKRIIQTIVAFIILLGIPFLTYFAIYSITPLSPLIYITASISGFSFICWTATIEILSTKYHWAKKLAYSILLGILPLVYFLLVDIIIDINLTANHFAEAEFSYVFGVCVAFWIDYAMPKLNTLSI